MKVLAVTTSHPAGELQRADVVVDSLRLAQPIIGGWMTGGDLPAGETARVDVTDE